MTDLSYKNKNGISLQDVLGVLTGKASSKKEIQMALSTESNIDTLLKKLEEVSLVEKQKDGAKMLYIAAKPSQEVKKTVSKKTKKSVKNESVAIKNSEEEVVKTNEVVSENTPFIDIRSLSPDDIIDYKQPEEISALPQLRKSTKANPTRTKTPVEVDRINKQTEVVSEKHQITSLVEVEEVKKEKNKTDKSRTVEVNEEDLSTLKKAMETKLGKEVTAVLHKRNERILQERKKSAQEIFDAEQKKLEEDAKSYDEENPFRFVLNFFTTTTNGENATPYFRRRDEYVVKSIYNKLKTLCVIADEYNVDQQNLPFYRIMTINVKERAIKMYHIDMNRVVRGVHTLFKIDEKDVKYIQFKN